MIDNGNKVELDIPRMFAGVAFRRDNTITFLCRDRLREGPCDAKIDGAPARITIAKALGYDRTASPFYSATILALTLPE